MRRGGGASTDATRRGRVYGCERARRLARGSRGTERGCGTGRAGRVVCDYGGCVAFKRGMRYLANGSRPLPSYPSGQLSTGLGPGRLRPPLTRRMRPWHWMAIDFTVGGLAGLGTVFASTHDVVAWPARFLLAAAVGLPIGLRRR